MMGSKRDAVLGQQLFGGHKTRAEQRESKQIFAALQAGEVCEREFKRIAKVWLLPRFPPIAELCSPRGEIYG